MRNAFYNISLSKYSKVTEQAANDLARFFACPWRLYEGRTNILHRLAACNLIDYLREDLQYDLVELVVEDGDYDMTVTFDMASTSRKECSRLELFWSVD